MINRVKNAGYSLIEAVIAVSILAIMMSTALSIIITAASTEGTNRDFLVANLLVQEGIERVENIYYTNLLKFGIENAVECGFVLPQTPIGTPIEGDDSCEVYTIPDGKHRLTVDSDLRNWGIESSLPDMIDEDVINPVFQLYTIEVSSEFGDDLTSIPIYVPRPATLTADYTETQFYREIETYKSATKVDIISRVAWYRSNGDARSIEFSVSLPLTL